jgi:bacteriorhodopsin
MTEMDDKAAYNRARKRVEAKLGFYNHLAVYVGVNIVLIIINLITTSENLWFKWPLMGWGIGLFFHALNVFVLSSGGHIKERMIEKEMEKTSKHNFKG